MTIGEYRVNGFRLLNDHNYVQIDTHLRDTGCAVFTSLHPVQPHVLFSIQSKQIKLA